jgi:hypothetical protein
MCCDLIDLLLTGWWPTVTFSCKFTLVIIRNKLVVAKFLC